jgi:4-hydroxybenzoate polyprenyltransferase
LAALRTFLAFVKFEHTLFSVPLLLCGAFLGAGSVPPPGPLLWILVAGAGARTLALSLNRIFDRDLDARNPRTASRELPAGKMTTGQAWLVAAAGFGLLLVAVLNLPPLCLKLLPIPIAIFALYPLLKRFTAAAHFGVGAALGFGPIAAYVAVTGELPPWGPVPLLALFTTLWVAGFDVIYATLDVDFDRREGLHSLPAALGRGRALAAAAGIHAVAYAGLVLLTARYLSTPGAWVFLGVTGVLLTIEHRQAHRVDLAFFKVNAVLGFVVFALVWTGLPGAA